MRTPASFNDFSVCQFMEWHKILKEEINVSAEEADLGITAKQIREHKLIACLIGKTVQDVEDLPRAEIKQLIYQANIIRDSSLNEKVVRFVRVNKTTYQLIHNASDLNALLSASQYTAFKEWTKTDAVEHMDKILSLMYTPYRLFRKPKLSDNLDKVAADFRQVKMSEVFGAVFFYAKQYKALNEASLPYFKTAVQQIEEHMKEVYKVLGQSSKKDMDGTT